MRMNPDHCSSCSDARPGTHCPYPGILIMVGNEGVLHIERCDECAIYETDDDARNQFFTLYLEQQTQERGELIQRIEYLLDDMPPYEMAPPIDYEAGTCGGVVYKLHVVAGVEAVLDMHFDPEDVDSARDLITARELLFAALASLKYAPHKKCVPPEVGLTRRDDVQKD